VFALGGLIAVAFLVSGLFAPNYIHQRQVQVQVEATGVSSSSHATDLPQWLISYLEWHNTVRSDPAVFAQAHVLIVDAGVGGLGDRLKHLPYYMLLRVLLIHWNRDCGIEEFFQPNVIDWRTPPHLLDSAIRLNEENDSQDKHNYIHHLVDDKQLEANKSNRVLQVSGNIQSLEKGLPQVPQASNNDRRVFKHIFQSLFKLSDPVQELLLSTKKEIGLGNDYVGVHLRARYPGVSKVLDTAGERVDSYGITNVTLQVKQEILKLSSHAIQCTRAAAGDKDAQVYFASDTVLAMKLQHEQDDRVVHLKTDQERVHTGVSSSKGPQCSQYYPAFVDLWLLSQAKCIGFGVGGYGALATMMSDLECWTIHQQHGFLTHYFAKATNSFNAKNGSLTECYLQQ
jgi:hypothetical protein